MTETLGPQLADVDDTSATWYRILRKVGLVYVFSRLCVLAGAAIVAVELQADINQTKGIKNVPFPDPHIAGRPLPSSALAPISDVLASWDGIWYLRIVRLGYPRQVQDNVTYFVADARAAFFPAYPMLVRAVDRVLPGGDTVAALFLNFVLGADRDLPAGGDGQAVVRRTGRRKGHGPRRDVPRKLRALVCVHRGVAAGLRHGVPVVSDVEAVGVGRRVGSAGHGDTSERPGAGAGVCRGRVLGDSQRARLAISRRTASRACRVHRLPGLARSATPARRASGFGSRPRRGARAPATD